MVHPQAETWMKGPSQGAANTQEMHGSVSCATHTGAHMWVGTSNHAAVADINQIAHLRYCNSKHL